MKTKNKQKNKIPDGWEVKKLGEVCDVSAGNSAPQKKEFFENGEFPFFRTVDVGRVHISNDLRIAKDYLNKKGIIGLRLFKKGTILMPKSGASTFLNHRVILGVDGYVASHLATINTDEKVLITDYLFHLLKNIKAQDLIQNHDYPSLKLSDIKEIEISFPKSLDEQKRIVGILDEVFADIEKAKENAEKNLENAKELFESYLQGVFENKGDEWEEKKLGEVCDTGAGGTPLKSNKEYYENADIPWLRSGEVCKKYIKESELYISENGLKNSSAKLFPPNTVLVAMYGATAGQVGILKFESTTNQAICGILPSEKVIPEFLYYFFTYKKEDLVKQAVGGAQPNISQIKIKNTKIPILSIEKQKEIVKKLDELSGRVEEYEAILRSKIAGLEELKKSVLEKAFNGEL
jgi:type I restriction enzyme S subunit